MAATREGNDPAPVLFVAHTRGADLLEDERILDDAFGAQSFFWTAGRRLGHLVREAVRQGRWLRAHLPQARAVYGCFADYHLVLPAWLCARRGVPLLVRLGGYDGNTLPKLGYGVFASRWRAPLARFVLRRATLLLPVTSSLVENQNAFADWPEVLTNGVRAHVPGLRVPHEVIPTGYDPDAWPLGPAERFSSVVTVGYVRTLRDARIKGLDLLFDAAHHLPGVPIRIIGVTPTMADVLRRTYPVPDHVELVPPVPRGELVAAYQQAAVYVQLSRTEGGLPNTVAEAMLCGCVPVVSRVGSMPETAGPQGVVVDTPQAEVIAAAVRKALALPSTARTAARRHIVEHFTLAQRQDRLVKAVARVMPAPRSAKL